MNILGIETSCDETGIAIYSGTKGLIAHALYSQIALHQRYGGVVPELASRDHVRKLLPLIDDCLQQAQLQKKDLGAIAYTAGPGLIGALLVGASVAKSLAYAWDIPAIAIHHMEGHLLAPMLETPKPEFPFLALLVSGGHTQIIKAQALGKYKLLGDTLDDAAGEAFDKTAKMLGLPYPGGPALAKLAKQGRPGKFNLPRPLLDRADLNFSFSGLKTATLLAYKQSDQSPQSKADLAHAFETAVTDVLTQKCKRAIMQTQIKQLVVAGGVSANINLRSSLEKMVAEQSAKVFFPSPLFCTDNGAMIAYAGFCHWQRGEVDDGFAIRAKARWGLAVEASTRPF